MNSPQKIDREGYLYVSLAAVLFAAAATCAKFLFNDGISAYQLIQLRTSLAFTGLMIWLSLRQPEQFKISWVDLPYFVSLGVFGIGAAQFFYLFAAVMWHILYPPLEAFQYNFSPVQWGWIIFIGVGGTTVPFWLYFEGIKRIQPTHASITATLEPIAAGIAAAIFLGEQMAPLQVLGGLIVIISIVVLLLNPRELS